MSKNKKTENPLNSSYYNFNRLYDFKDKRSAVNNLIKQMLNCTNNMFTYKNLPEDIPARNLEIFVQTSENFGTIWALDNEEKHRILIGSLGGEYTWLYEPSICVVANPYLRLNKTYEINKDCVLLRNDSLQTSLLPICRFYATLLVEIDITIRQTLVNKRNTAIISAGDDKTYESAVSYLKSLEDGDLAVIKDSKFFESLKTVVLNNSNNSIKELIEIRQYILGQWYIALGIDAPFNMKREAINSAETNLSEDILRVFPDDMLKCREEWVEKVNKMFNLNIEVSFNSTWYKNVQYNELKMENNEDNVEVIDNEIENDNRDDNE